MGRTNYSYNGMLSAIARKPLHRFTNYAKNRNSLVELFDYDPTINTRGHDSLTNIISIIFNVPEEYIKTTNVQRIIITLNGYETVYITKGTEYVDLGVTLNIEEPVTLDVSNLNVDITGIYTITYTTINTQVSKNRYIRVIDYGTVYLDGDGKLKASGITSITRGQEYTFYFSSDDGTNIALSTSLNGANLTEGITTTDVSLIFAFPLFYPFDNIYIKSLDTPDIGSQLGVTGSMTTGTIYFDNNGKLRASGINSFNRGQEYTFYFSSDYGTNIALSTSLNGANLTEGISNTETTLTVTLPLFYPFDNIYIKSLDTPDIGSQLGVTGSMTTGTIYFDNNGKLRASGITLITKGQEYTFYFSSDYGTKVLLALTEDGATFEQGVTSNTDTTLTFTFTATTKSIIDTIYIKSQTTQGIGSSFPVYIPETKLLASDGAANDIFGTSVSISGDGLTAIVGASQDDDNGSNSGSAYIFNYVNGAWSQTTKLARNNIAPSDRFGHSVSISEDGTTAVVGAYFKQGPYFGQYGMGAIYIFNYVNGAWSQTTKLLAYDRTNYDFFGISVSISGDGLTIIVGATGNDDNGSSSGSAYIFKYVNGAWSSQTKLLASDGATGHIFGSSVSISGDGLTAIIGARNYNSTTGAAYIFNYANGTWSQTTKLLASDGAVGHLFGTSVSISGDGLTAIVGAPENDDNGSRSGSAYIFNYANGTWSQTTKLLASDGAASDVFGTSVSISGDGLTAIVGANQDDSKGSSYVFKYANGAWSQTTKLLATDGAAGDFFGTSVSISEDGATAIVGATGNNDNGSDSGSAYIYNYL